MSLDTDTSGLTQEDILGKLSAELGGPTCTEHPGERVVKTFFEKSVPVFVEMSCGHRLMVRPQSSQGKHEWHRG